MEGLNLEVKDPVFLLLILIFASLTGVAIAYVLASSGNTRSRPKWKTRILKVLKLGAVM